MWPGTSPLAAVNAAAKMVVAALIIVALYAGRDLLIPLSLAALLSFVLHPPVRRLVQWGCPHGIAVGLVMAVLLGALSLAATVTGRQAAHVMSEMVTHEANLLDKARFINSKFGGIGVWEQAVTTLRNVELEVRNPAPATEPTKIEVATEGNSFWSTILEYIRMSVPSLVTAALVFLMTLFILLQYGDLRDRAVRLMGTREIGRSAQAFDDAGSDLAHFLLLQSGVNACFGIYIGIALWAIGIPSPAVWGTLAAIMRFIPYIGSFVSAAFPLALAATVDPGWLMLIETAGVFLIGEPLVGQIVEPLLFGSQTRLSPLAILVGAIFWTLLWGPVGLVLAVPMTLAVVVLGQHIPNLEILRILLGNEPPLEPKEQLYHRLLAGEAIQAAKEADDWISHQTVGKYLDEVAMPSLRIASSDQRRTVLGREQGRALNATIAEYVQLVKESLELKREQRDSPAVAADTMPVSGTPLSVVVLAGRGNLDLAASELISAAIGLELGVDIQCPSLGGLTGITAVADANDVHHPDVVVLVSVGAVSAAQFELLRRRLRRTFPAIQVLIMDWDGSLQQESHSKAEGVRYVGSVASAIEAIGKLADSGTPSSGLAVKSEANKAA